MKPNFTDGRGTITDLLVNDEYSVTHITFQPGAVRGNHVHNETRQTDLILKGKLIVSIKEGKTVQEKILGENEVVVIPAGSPHAYKAVDYSEILSICKGKRKGEDYETDVIRLDTPILK